MSARCPNCEHASGYFRSSSDDWRCRRCGYIWSEGEAQGAASGDAAADAVNAAAPAESVPSKAASPAGPAGDDVKTALSAMLATGPGVSSDIVERILRERADGLAEESATRAEGETRLLALFSLGEEWYAVDVASVREIRREFEVTKVPGVGESVTGVINLRGEIISATDLAGLLGAESASESQVMMICDLAEITTGLLVDRVADVVEVLVEDVEPPLATLERTKAEYTVGQVAVDDRLVTILDLNRVLTPVGV